MSVINKGQYVTAIPTHFTVDSVRRHRHLPEVAISLLPGATSYDVSGFVTITGTASVPK